MHDDIVFADIAGHTIIDIEAARDAEETGDIPPEADDGEAAGEAAHG